MREGIEVIRDFGKLRFYAEKFSEGMYNFVAVFGAPGRLKSSAIEAAVRGKAHVISGRSTPFEVFCELQENRDKLIVVDDVAGLYDEPAGRRLLENLTNPKPPKTVHWTTDAPTNRGLAKTFQTVSKVCIIDNNWGDASKLAALEDRGRLFYFDPSPAELHAEMRRVKWFKDEDILAFIETILRFCSSLSARVYVKAAEAKRAGEDWRSFVTSRCIDQSTMLLLLLLADDSIDEPLKKAVWCQRAGKSASEYDRLRKEVGK